MASSIGKYMLWLFTVNQIYHLNRTQEHTISCNQLQQTQEQGITVSSATETQNV